MNTDKTTYFICGQPGFSPVVLSDLGMLSRVDMPEGPRWHHPQVLGA